MLDKTAIYHKSARGSEALASHTHALPPKLRSMLILCNGKRPVAELAMLGQGLGRPEDLLAQLEAEGYIEPGPMREGPPSTPAPLFSASQPAALGPPSVPPRYGPPSVPPRYGPPSVPPRYGPASVPAPLAPASVPAPLEAGETFAVSAPAPLGAEPPRIPLVQAQEFAVRRLLDLLGPAADDLCGAIEDAATAQDFRAVIARTAEALSEFVGPELAAQYVKEVETQRVR